MYCFEEVEIPLSSKTTVHGFSVTNTTYAALAMRDGDSFTAAFSAGSWFKLIVKGYDSAGVLTGTKELYLADYRSTTESDHYILDSWKYLDLSDLGEVVKLTVVMDSSDTGTYGINTPAYFAMDDLAVKGAF